MTKKPAAKPARPAASARPAAPASGVDAGLVRELAGLSFVERGHNVVILGPPGVGKTQPT